MVWLQFTKYGGENTEVNKFFICTQFSPQLITGVLLTARQRMAVAENLKKKKKAHQNEMLFTGLCAYGISFMKSHNKILLLCQLCQNDIGMYK